LEAPPPKERGLEIKKALVGHLKGGSVRGEYEKNEPRKPGRTNREAGRNSMELEEGEFKVRKKTHAAAGNQRFLHKED